MISIRKKENKILIIQNNKWMYNLLKSTYLSFFIIAGIFSILKNNTGMIYINGITCLILYFLSMKISKFKKKVFIELSTQSLKIYSSTEERKFILDNIKNLTIKKIHMGLDNFAIY